MKSSFLVNGALVAVGTTIFFLVPHTVPSRDIVLMAVVVFVSLCLSDWILGRALRETVKMIRDIWKSEQ